jgi:regulator of sirC expression with transglutaminase-like and TPR domain
LRRFRGFASRRSDWPGCIIPGMDLDRVLADLAADAAAPCDVIEVALWLARDEFPDLDVAACLDQFEEISDQIRPFLRGDLEDRIQELSRFLFDDLRFRGNVQNYYEADNSYLNRVLDRRLGIPITLSLVTMAVGTRAGLAVSGVGLPGHFITKAVEAGREVLFDPFHGGHLLTPDECEQLVQQVIGVPFVATPEHFQAVPAGRLLRRLLTNLKGVYLRTEEFAKAARTIGRIRQLVPDDAEEGRDLGVCLLRAGQPGRAIDLLDKYLATDPACEDADKVRQLLERARCEVARWN